MVLGKLLVPGRPTNLDMSRTRAYCACSRCEWGLFGHFSLVYHFSFLSPSFWEMARYRPKYCLKGPLSPKQLTKQPTNKPTNQPTNGPTASTVRPCPINILITIKLQSTYCKIIFIKLRKCFNSDIKQRLITTRSSRSSQ